MIIIMGTVRIPEDAIDKVRPAMEKMLAASRAEDGCHTYNYAQDVLDARVIHISERWRDQAALQAHFNTVHMADWRAAIGELGFTDRDLALYETGEGTPI